MPKSKRKHLSVQKLKPRNRFDYVVYFFTFVTPLFELPQAIEIFANQSAQDVSMLTWAFSVLITLSGLPTLSVTKSAPYS